MRNSVSKVLLPVVVLMLLLVGGLELHAKSLDEMIAESKAEKQKQLEAEAEAERQRKAKAAADVEAKRKAEEAAAEKVHQQAAEEKRKKELAEKRRADTAKARKVAEAKAAKERKRQEAAQKKAEAERQRQAKIAADTEAWNTARRANTQAAYNTYLQNFASGKYVLEAKKLLNALQKPVATARPAVASVSQGTAIEPQMVSIPAGTFTMGCLPNRDVIAGMGRCPKEELPAHKVSVREFKMSKYEVTFDEWDRCIQAGGCVHAEDRGFGRGKRPVIHVSWQDAQVYIRWLNHQTGKNYRLPTEAEWEYAARAGSDTVFPWGNSINCSQANYGLSECGTDRTKPVGSYAANRFGLFDTVGNALEWTQDCWTGSHQGAAPDGAARQGCGATAGRVFRGGSWNDAGKDSRSSLRFGFSSDSSYFPFGFRLSLSD